MNKGLTTQEQIALAKEILQVKNRRERSLKLGEILDREKLSSDDMYELYNTLLTTIRVYGDVIGFDDKDFQEMALTILVLEKIEEAKQARVAQRGAIPLLAIALRAKKRERSRKMNELERTALNEILRTVTYIAEKVDELDSKISLNDSQVLEHQEN